MNKKVFLIIGLVFIAALPLITYYEAIFLKQDFEYMLILNSAETLIFIIGLLSGYFYTMAYVYRNKDASRAI